MYEMACRVRYSECGVDNKIKIPAIVNYFQDCTTENSEQLGVGYTYLQEKKRAWILNSWQIFLNRRPNVGEEIQISTWATGFQGVFGPRDFQMLGKDGEVLACAHSLWVYVDTQKGRPIKPDEAECAVYSVGEPLPIAGFSRKINVPIGLEKVDTFTVHKYHIDTNQHMNNAKYLELACEALPEQYDVASIRVEYKKAAVYGDKIVMKRAVDGKCITVVLCDENDQTFAVVEFTGDN